LHLEQKTLEEEQHLLKEKRINLMRDEKEVRHKRCSEEERKHAEERLAADQSGRENKQQIKNYEVWKKRQQSRSKKFAYIYHYYCFICYFRICAGCTNIVWCSIYSVCWRRHSIFLCWYTTKSH